MLILILNIHENSADLNIFVYFLTLNEKFPKDLIS